MTTKRKILMEYPTIAVKKEKMRRDCKDRKYNNEKKNENADKAVDRNDELLLCLLTMENKKEKEKKKVLLRCLQRQVCCASLMVTHYICS